MYSWGGPTTELRSSDDLISTATPVEGNESGEEEDAILLYTGGTTGRSKGVRLTHRNVFSNGQQCTAPMKINAGDVYLHVAPMFHSADLLGSGYTQAGASHAYLPVFTPANLLKAFQDYGVTCAMMAPTMVILTLQEADFGSYDLSSLDRLYYGSFADGGRVDPTYDGGVPDCQYPTGVRTYRNLPILTTLDEDVHRQAIETGEYNILKAAGRPLVGIDMRIVDPDGNEVLPGSREK